MNYYILNGHTPVREPNMLAWGQWMETADCHVNQTTIGVLWISTIFLGIDHNFFAGQPPRLFETIIFGFDHDDSYQTRCATWEQAERMHALACDIAETMVREADATLAGFMAKLNISNQGSITESSS
jgi:hypothetical protein